MALLNGCPQCGVTAPATVAADGASRTCPTCRGPLPAATSSDRAPQRPAPRRSTAGLVAVGAARGLGTPFVLVFVLVVDLGINSLLGIQSRSSNDLSFTSSLPRSAALLGAVVLICATLAAVLGGLAGDAIGHAKGAVIGAAACFFVGCAVAGAVAELLGRDRT